MTSCTANDSSQSSMNTAPQASVNARSGRRGRKSKQSERDSAGKVDVQSKSLKNLDEYRRRPLRKRKNTSVERLLGSSKSEEDIQPERRITLNLRSRDSNTRSSNANGADAKTFRRPTAVDVSGHRRSAAGAPNTEQQRADKRPRVIELHNSIANTGEHRIKIVTIRHPEINIRPALLTLKPGNGRKTRSSAKALSETLAALDSNKAEALLSSPPSSAASSSTTSRYEAKASGASDPHESRRITRQASKK